MGDPTALRKLLDSLDACRSSLHWRQDVCAFLVVVGVVSETAFVIWEYLSERRDFRRGSIHSPERPSRLKFGLEMIDVALVAFGVAGELYFAAKIDTLETRLRD